MQRFSIPLRGGHLSGLNFGRASGPIDLVFLHATGFCAQVYRQLLEPFGQQRRVVALDLRGHGHSTLPARPSALTHWYGYAGDVVAAVRQLSDGGPPPRVIAGHSMGGTVALLALASEPSVAGSLLMIDPAVVLPKMRRILMLPFAPLLMRNRIPIARSALRRRPEFPGADAVVSNYRGRGAFRTWLPGFLEDYVEGGFEPAPEGGVRLRCAPAWESATFTSHRHDLAKALRTLRAPARILVAEHNSTSARAVPMIREHAPGIEIEHLPGSSHFIPMERPDLVRERVLALAELAAPCVTQAG